MTLRVVVRAPSLSPEAVATFRQDVRAVFSTYGRLRRRLGIPASAITALLADDFGLEVHRHSPWADATPFDATRIGGVVAGKNLDQSGDYSVVTIVFNADFWRGADTASRLDGIAIIAHELAHPLIERVRYLSGVMDGVVLPSITPHEGARSGARILAGEYRADVLSEATIGAWATVTVGGVTQPARSWLSHGDRYLATLHEVLDAAYPAWPDTVDAYREFAIPLEEMWQSIVSVVDQTLTVLIHAQASADVAEVGIDLLAHPTVATLPAVELYLAEPIRPFLSLLRRVSAVLTVAEAPVIEAELVRAGSAAYLEIWRRLGLRPRDMPRPLVYVDVDAPLR